MLTLYDYRPSQNGWKVRQLLAHRGLSCRTREVAIFAGAGRHPGFLARNPAGAVPVLELEDGRCLPESNAILCYLAEGTAWLPGDAWLRAQVLRWLFWEEDAVQNGLASLRHWRLTGKVARRSAEAIAQREAATVKALDTLERWLTGREFLTDAGYTIADIAVFAYVSRADEAGVPLAGYPAVSAWVARVRGVPGHLDEVHPYSLDPASAGELP